MRLTAILTKAIPLLLALLASFAAHAASPVTVFASGRDGYHTYRIPVLLRATNRTLLAFCEGRKDSASDSGRIDLLLKRSQDNGRTWSPQEVIWSDGANVCGNPAPVLDATTGTIWLLMNWSLISDTEQKILDGQARDGRRIFVTSSTNNGISWRTPKEITSAVKKPHWRWYATGPANGIQLQHGPHAGRLVIPANHSDHSVEGQHPYRSHVLYSDDHGETWHIGGIEEEKTNESTIAELPDGTLVHNMRSYHGRNRRAVARSLDGGATWSKVELDPALVEPICQASLLAIGGRVYFSNPASTKRENLTIRCSSDGCRSWTTLATLHPGPSAYSSLADLGNGELGCFFEAGQVTPYETLLFARSPR